MTSSHFEPLNLALMKREYSVLDGLVLLEVVPLQRIKALLKSNLLLLEWNRDKQDRKNYSNEKQQITAYLKNYNKNLGAVNVKYGKPRHKWGRSFPNKSLGLTTIRRIVRNSLIDGLYYDCDLKNAQPEIIRNLCESNDIPCPYIKQYCANRPSILSDVQQFYNVSRDQAKNLFIRLCFFGSFVGWSIDNNLQGKAPLEFITKFERELKYIVETVKKANPTLYHTARKKKADVGEAKENEVLGSFFALYNQEYESRIIEAVLCYLMNKTDLMKVAGSNISAGTYEYDGIKLLKANVDSFEGGIEAVITILKEKTFELTGFRLEWSAKSLDEKYDLDEWIDAVAEDEKPNKELRADMDSIQTAINDMDAGVVEVLMEILPGHFIYSVDKSGGSNGDWYGWNGSRWEKSDAPLRKAILYEIQRHWKSIMDKWDIKYLELKIQADEEPDDNFELWKNTRKLMQARIKMLKTSNGVNSVVSIAKTLMANYTLEFDTKEDLFGCENGVIDIAEECFRYYRFDDYITWTCRYDFSPNLHTGFKVQIGEEELEVEGKKVKKPIFRHVTETDIFQESDAYDCLEGIFKQIFPDKELREYFFKVISTGMTGRAIEKFFVFNGAGRNGKGFTNEFLQIVLGDYYESVSPTIFSEDQKNKTSSGANPEIAKLDKKRYVVAKEPKKDNPLHNSVIKDLTGGGFTSARMLYSSKTNVKLSMTCVMECNPPKPPFSDSPKDADMERINDILFQSKFTGEEKEWDDSTGETNYIYPLNVTFKDLEWKKKHSNAMLNILLHHLLSVKAQKYIVDFFKPDSVKERSLAYLQDSYDIHKLIVGLFEKRCEANADCYLNWKGNKADEDWTLTKIIKVLLKSSEFYDLPRKKQEEYSVKGIEEFLRTNNYYKGSVYTNTERHATLLKNWRLKVIRDEEEEE
jgi:phage/plasmid-associated DNA primase